MSEKEILIQKLISHKESLEASVSVLQQSADVPENVDSIELAKRTIARIDVALKKLQ